MSNKYSRHSSVVSRTSDASDSEDHWLKQFQKSLQKGAVQSKNVDSSLFDQINSIMNGKSKYPSVAAAVQDMQERSGLTAYLEKMSNVDRPKKVASASQPAIFDMCPQIKTTIENYVKDTKGNLPVPAIIEKIKAIHSRDVSDPKHWEDDDLIRYVSRQNLIAKTDNPESYQNYADLGRRDNGDSSDIDASNSDAFHALMPAKQ